VKEGEMSLAQANKEKAKVKLSSVRQSEEDSVKLVPVKLQELIQRAANLELKVRRLDATIHPVPAAAEEAGNPVERQLGLLKAAFEQDAV
jgi:regulator of CtrA degradation